MVEAFRQMIFNMNEEMHRTGLLDDDKYITEFHYLASMVCTAILIYGFIEIVLKSEWFEKNEEIYFNRAIKIITATSAVIVLSYALYLGAYMQILFFIVAMLIMLVVATRDEFAGFRRWLDERFGWLF